MMLEEMGQRMQPQPQPEGLDPQQVIPQNQPPQQSGLWSGMSQNVFMVVMDREETLTHGVSCLLTEQPDDERLDNQNDLKRSTFGGARFSCQKDTSIAVSIFKIAFIVLLYVICLAPPLENFGVSRFFFTATKKHENVEIQNRYDFFAQWILI